MEAFQGMDAVAEWFRQSTEDEEVSLLNPTTPLTTVLLPAKSMADCQSASYTIDHCTIPCPVYGQTVTVPATLLTTLPLPVQSMDRLCHSASYTTDHCTITCPVYGQCHSAGYTIDHCTITCQVYGQTVRLPATLLTTVPLPGHSVDRLCHLQERQR